MSADLFAKRPASAPHDAHGQASGAKRSDASAQNSRRPDHLPGEGLQHRGVITDEQHRCAHPGCRERGCYGQGPRPGVGGAIVFWCPAHVPPGFLPARSGKASNPPQGGSAQPGTGPADGDGCAGDE